MTLHQASKVAITPTPVEGTRRYASILRTATYVAAGQDTTAPDVLYVS